VLLAAAARVFAAHGYHGASIDQIAQEAGITKPVIYHHFESKQALHRAVFEHYAQELLETAAALGEHGTPRERFGDLVRGLFAYAHENPHVWQLLLGDSNDPERALRQQQLRTAGTEQSAQRLLTDPTFRPASRLGRKRTAEVAAQLIRSAVDGLVTWSLEHPRVAHTALADAAAELIWNGLEATTTPA
jgi:AcrR family transcriptional regulator